MAHVAVAPHKRFAGFDGRRQKVSQAFEILDLRDALTRTYSSDAHLVTYVVPGAARQPRINKPGLATFDGFPAVDVFFCDLDNPGHAPWTPELHAAALGRYGSLEVLQTVGIYHTAHGARLVQPILSPVPVEQVEPFVARWLTELSQAGLVPDWACKDWTRLFRLPNVLRDGRAFRSPYINLDRMRPIALEPLWDPPPARAAPTPRAPGPVPRLEWRVDVPPEWREPVQTIAAAVRGVQSEWHTLFLALSGALLRMGVPPEQLPAIVRAISLATCVDTRTEDRELSARSTAERHLAGLPCSGFSTLALKWPEVAVAVDCALTLPEGPLSAPQAVDASALPPAALGPQERHSADPAAPVPPPSIPPPLADSQAALRAAIRDAPDGLSLIAAECGLGKTAAAIEVAAERASRSHASPAAEGKRAPAHSKTAISVDKHELALQIVADLAARGVQARRLFGPLSLKHEDGTPVCQLHQVARHLVDGGQPMQWELCHGRDIEPCPHRDTCPARDGIEGPDDARVTVGPHQLVGALDREAGTTGLLVIDEPPDLLDL
ncbi:MAG: DEAD/DEAH box helicase family protein, partial [Polyangia bacterium]|nr:DEAD/DEAH box helicase family protein [Polyangia bacterium]